MEIILKNKPMNNIDISSIIDTFQEVTRLNFGMPNLNNSGSKMFRHIANCHVYRALRKRSIKHYSKLHGYTPEHLNTFIQSFDEKKT